VTASFADNEIWHVMIADDMKRMDVDQLDDAFRLSVVDASTLVWKTGMKTWRRLGSIADLDDAEPPARHAPPPPPRPLPPPAPAKPPAFAVAPAFPMSPGRAVPVAPAFPAAPIRTQPLAPVYVPELVAPNPYALPRRATFDSEVDFRRRPGGVRWGRWFAAGLLVSVALLAAYRQNLLRSGARAVGLEQKYLHGEMRVTALVSQQAPAPVRFALGRLGLFPGPNAAELAKNEHPPIPSAPPAAAVEQKPLPAKEPSPKTDSDIKTVSLDALPVLGGNLAAASNVSPPAPPIAPAAAPATAPVSRPSEAKAVAAKPAAPRLSAPETSKARPAAKTEPTAHKAPAPVAKAEPAKTEPASHKAPPAPANESPLKAAIRMAIAADGKK